MSAAARNNIVACPLWLPHGNFFPSPFVYPLTYQGISPINIHRGSTQRLPCGWGVIRLLGRGGFQIQYSLSVSSSIVLPFQALCTIETVPMGSGERQAGGAPDLTHGMIRNFLPPRK